MIAAPTTRTKWRPVLTNQSKQCFFRIQPCDIRIFAPDKSIHFRRINAGTAIKSLMFHPGQTAQFQGRDAVLAAAESNEISLRRLIPAQKINGLADVVSEFISRQTTLTDCAAHGCSLCDCWMAGCRFARRRLTTTPRLEQGSSSVLH